MLNTISDDWSNLACSDHGQDGEHEDDVEEDQKLRELCDDDEPGWVMERISKKVQYRVECFGQQQMKLDELN